MNLLDALTVTALGMTVVFSGLLLTSGVIVAFARVPVLLERLRRPPVEGSSVPAESDQNVAPEVVSVIAAVLEIERRLYHAEEGRLTIGRGPAPGPGGPS
jgi:Na+-transporting methylmalonyl-CoA/oxaloacetate decarboxylase gamma subunit